MKKCHPNEHVDACKLCQLYVSNAAYRAHIDGLKTCPVHPRKPRGKLRLKTVKPVRPVRCESFTGRTEFVHGCNGWKCRGGCRLGHPAVPGKFCQTECTSYVPDPDYDEAGPAGWLE